MFSFPLDGAGKKMNKGESPTENSTRLTSDVALSDPQLHDLVPFVIGNRNFAVLAENVEGTVQRKVPAALPRAPAAILGVVCARGRMLTVLDSVALVSGEPHQWSKTLPCVIALRGDEQLALAAEESRDAVTIASSDLHRTTEIASGAAPVVVLGIARYGGEEITVLDADQLFPAAMRCNERRRRRF